MTKRSNPYKVTPVTPEVTILPIEQVLSYSDPNVPIARLWKEEKAYLDRLTAEITAGGLTKPIQLKTIGGKTVVWDGMHRLAVAQKLGIKDIPVKFIGEVAIPKAEAGKSQRFAKNPKYSLVGGNPMTKKNPKRCPICKTLSEWRFQAGGWYCPKCKSWFFPSELSDAQFRSYMRGHKNPVRGDNPMAKKKRTKKMKVLGIPVMTIVIIGGLVWLVTRS